MTITSAHCGVPEPGQVTIHPGARKLHVDRVVALPHLFGPSTPGVPGDSPGGFISIDPHCKVRRLERVYAAGDATDFAIKHGGIAAHQADTAAEAIAALAGAPVEPKPFRPDIHAILLGGNKPLYMSVHVTWEGAPDRPSGRRRGDYGEDLRRCAEALVDTDCEDWLDLLYDPTR